MNCAQPLAFFRYVVPGTGPPRGPSNVKATQSAFAVHAACAAATVAPGGSVPTSSPAGT
jgi:hypothetical protein